MKPPRAIIVAVGCYAILIVSRICLFVMNWSNITFRLTAIFLVIHAIQMFGIIGLLLKKRWSRKFTMVLFMIITVMQVSFLDDHFKKFDMPNLVWGLVWITVSLYVFHQFYTEPDIGKYLKS